LVLVYLAGDPARILYSELFAPARVGFAGGAADVLVLSSDGAGLAGGAIGITDGSSGGSRLTGVAAAQPPP